jgi:hypothetical protein
VTSCPPQTYVDDGVNCVACESPCKYCSGTKDNCTDCIGTQKLYLTSCIPDCPKDTTVLIGNRCYDCTHNCKT